MTTEELIEALEKALTALALVEREHEGEAGEALASAALDDVADIAAEGAKLVHNARKAARK